MHVYSSLATYKIFQLSPGLFNGSRFAAKDNGHTTQICNLSLGNHQRVNVEASSGENTRDTTYYSGLVLHQTVEDVSLVHLVTSHGGCVVENVGHGLFGRGGRRVKIIGCQRRMTLVRVRFLVCDGRG